MRCCYTLILLPHVYFPVHLHCIRLALSTHGCRRSSLFQGVDRHRIRHYAVMCLLAHGIRQGGHPCNREVRMVTQEKSAQAQLLIPQTPWKALLAMRLACPARQGTKNVRCTDSAAICSARSAYNRTHMQDTWSKRIE